MHKPDFFADSASRVAGERSGRLARAKKVLPFGVTYLDEAMGGIFPNDLILIGASTGRGKTQLANSIAAHVATRGKNVYYFALEAEDGENERRTKFALVSDLARQNGVTRPLDFIEWNKGELDKLLGPYEERADERLTRDMVNQFTFYRTGEFTAADFERHVDSVKDHADLIILDHVHYVDVDEDANENRAYKRLVKRIRDVSIRFGKPVIVVAHLRKPERRGAPIIPSEHDFYGTSDIVKISTKAIVIAPAFDQESEDPTEWPTYVGLVKCRMEGSRTRYVARLRFDVKTGVYKNKYALGRAIHGGTEWEQCTASETPHWARGCES